MRKLLVVLSVASTLAACSTAQQAPQPVAMQPVAQPVPVAGQPMQQSMSAIPEWFTDHPKSDDTLYSVGDGVSSSVSGALGNARANAFEGICQGAGGTVRSQTKIFRQDTETGSTSMSTTAIRNFCADVSVAGSHVEKSKVIVENGRYHAFVLVSLSLTNKTAALRKQQDRAEEASVKANAQKEFKELDDLNDKAKVVDAVPQSNVDGIQLLDVDNQAYKAKRDAALQKDGAVIGHTTLDNQ
jgi:hypothetical protein